MSVTSAPGCKLEACCDVAVHLPLERELCPFDLAPVTSTTIQMLFGDTVAIALMQVRAHCTPLGATTMSCSPEHISSLCHTAYKGAAPVDEG